MFDVGVGAGVHAVFAEARGGEFGGHGEDEGGLELAEVGEQLEAQLGQGGVVGGQAEARPGLLARRRGAGLEVDAVVEQLDPVGGDALVRRFLALADSAPPAPDC